MRPASFFGVWLSTPAFALAGLLGCKTQVVGHASLHAGTGGDLKPDPAHVHFRLEGDQITWEGPGEVRFGTDSADLVGDWTFATLDALAQFLLENPEVKIRVEGYTDSRGTEEHNRQLSEARAKAVVAYLVQMGVPEERLRYEGLGESRPKVEEPPECRERADGMDPADCEALFWRYNRRTEFHVLEGRASLERRSGRGRKRRR